MRIRLLLLLAACCAVKLAAAPVGRAKAVASARSLFQARGIQLRDSVMVEYEAVGKSDGKPRYYIVNNGSNGGFVIISADSRTPQVLGYSDHGTFNSNDIPSNMRGVLDGYLDEMEHLDEMDAPVMSSGGRMNVSPTMHAIKPLLSVHWSQNAPYNSLCPIGTYDRQSPVGCVATAMAQVMGYYRYPAATTADIPGYYNKYTYVTPLWQEGVPKGTIIDWDNILDTYKGLETEGQKLAVAQLSRYCGVAVNMGYSNSWSAAYSADIMTALATYFGYDPAMEMRYRAYCSSNDWNQTIYRELNDGRPVIYSAKSTGGAHAFVVDGYDGDNMFHVNWGWNNGTDGYFLLSVLNPGNNSGTGASSTTDGYSMDQMMIVGIQPAVMPPTGYAENIHLNFVMNYVSGAKVNVTYRNCLNTKKTFQAALGYLDAQGNICLASGSVATTLSAQSYSTRNFTVNISTPGKYKLFPVSRQYGTDSEWIADEHSVDYVDCVVDSKGGITLVKHPSENLAVAFSYGDNRIVGVEQQVNIFLSNYGEEFLGNMYLFVSKTTDKGSPVAQFGLSLVGGMSQEVQCAFFPTSAGEYNVWLATDSNGDNVMAQSSVTIDNGSFTSEPVLAIDLEVDNSTGNYVYGHMLKGKAIFTNNTEELWVGSPYIVVFHNTEYTGSYKSVMIQKTSLVINPGQTVEVPFECSGSYNEFYRPSVRYSLYGATVKNTKTLEMVPGLMAFDASGNVHAISLEGDVKVDEDILAVDFTGIDLGGITKVIPNSNPNTLYYFEEGAAVPEGLDANANNIVIGGHAAMVSLADGSGFYVPVTFTADKVTYSRVPTLLTDGSGRWETLALPFDVEEITVDGKNVDFFHAANDRGKDFWVRCFTGYQGTNMIYGFTDKMESNVPYLVAFPGDRWGKQYSFEGKTVEFTGYSSTIHSDSKIVSGSEYYSFIGTTLNVDLNNVYTLDKSGNFFRLNSQKVEPFRAYIRPKYDVENMANLLQIFTDEVSGIESVDGGLPSLEPVYYNLSGQRVDKRYRGVVVTNGKKIINK